MTVMGMFGLKMPLETEFITSSILLWTFSLCFLPLSWNSILCSQKQYSQISFNKLIAKKTVHNMDVCTVFEIIH